ncbi:TspO/MBR family protein [Sphingomonas nostoxanthinifaciens]|uniref:TspO/MBR family protein n=1 Tax=Sphingomonas nostoxanthinifaciens TaxID=2872652 RepID=UPI001CC1CBDC|nr:TspO/MBR family protein [Sphingomonas nostoxanthinifaciens]UAK25529.1 tryptophan-rich sensory protein [Sphingomonas nostoxanthinifaciens]
MNRREPVVRSAGLSPLVAGGIVIGVLGLSALIGRRNAPDPSHPGIRNWYRRLDKPGFTPPDAVFGAVWPALETGMAVGGYRLLRHEPSARRNASVGLWLVTTAMIGGWTEIFFRERALASSAAASGAMLATTAAYVATTHRVDRVAQATAVPLMGWLAFATVLATRVWQRNRPAGAPR